MLTRIRTRIRIATWIQLDHIRNAHDNLVGKSIRRLLTSQVPCRQTLVVRKATLRLQGVTTPQRSLSTLWLLLKSIKTAVDKRFSATGVPAHLPGDLLSPPLCRCSLGHKASMHVCSSGPPLICSFLRILMLWKMQRQLCRLIPGELCHLLNAIFKGNTLSVVRPTFSHRFTKALFRKALALEALLQTQQALQVMLLAQHQEPQDKQVSITCQLLGTSLNA